LVVTPTLRQAVSGLMTMGTRQCLSSIWLNHRLRPWRARVKFDGESRAPGDGAALRGRDEATGLHLMLKLKTCERSELISL